MNAANAIAGRAGVVGCCRVGPLGAAGKLAALLLRCVPATISISWRSHESCSPRLETVPGGVSNQQASLQTALVTEPGDVVGRPVRVLN